MSTRKLPAEPMSTDIWVIVNTPSPGIELHDAVFLIPISSRDVGYG
jgi:hypothetical protein